MNRSTQINILNFLLFQAGWFACVLGAANGEPWVGFFVVGALVVVHIAMARQKIPELSLLFSIGILGFLWESALAASGLLVYEHGQIQQHMAPFWMAALWINFATTLNLSLAWLKPRKMIAAMIASISGPLAYYAGMSLGALVIPDLILGLAILAAGWALLFPLGLIVAERFNGFSNLQQPEYLVLGDDNHV